MVPRLLRDNRRGSPCSVGSSRSSGSGDRLGMDPAVEAVRREALWFEPTAHGMGPVVDALGAARLVLVGEATHGTHEFYRTRAELTKALILHKGFNVVAVEADWPDAYRANRWVRHEAEERNADAALGDFARFPRW